MVSNFREKWRYKLVGGEVRDVSSKALEFRSKDGVFCGGCFEAKIEFNWAAGDEWAAWVWVVVAGASLGQVRLWVSTYSTSQWVGHQSWTPWLGPCSRQPWPPVSDLLLAKRLTGANLVRRRPRKHPSFCSGFCAFCTKLTLIDREPAVTAGVGEGMTGVVGGLGAVQKRRETETQVRAW